MIQDNELKENLQSMQRKFYFKPHIEIVPLLPKQTVLGIGCFSLSLQSGPDSGGCGISVENCQLT